MQSELKIRASIAVLKRLKAEHFERGKMGTVNGLCTAMDYAAWILGDPSAGGCAMVGIFFEMLDREIDKEMKAHGDGTTEERTHNT